MQLVNITYHYTQGLTQTDGYVTSTSDVTTPYIMSIQVLSNQMILARRDIVLLAKTEFRSFSCRAGHKHPDVVAEHMSRTTRADTGCNAPSL